MTNRSSIGLISPQIRRDIFFSWMWDRKREAIYASAAGNVNVSGTPLLHTMTAAKFTVYSRYRVIIESETRVMQARRISLRRTRQLLAEILVQLN